MTDVLVADYIISFDHAMKLIKKLKVKKHAKLGFWHELEDLNCSVWQTIRLFVPNAGKPGYRISDEEYELHSRHVYADYKGFTPAFRLKVFRPA